MYTGLIEADTKRREYIEAENKARREVVQILTAETFPKDLYYHGPPHTTQFVYPEAKALATVEFAGDEYFDECMLVVAVAALFHDTGFIDQYPDNEPLGAARARDFALASENKILRENAEAIAAAILNTNMKSKPKNKIEEVLRDADLSVMGSQAFGWWSNRLRQEAMDHEDSNLHLPAMDEAFWARAQLQFLSSHQWFTDAAVERYQTQKEKNIALFKARYRV